MADAGGLVVTGVGMRTAVGQHATQTCASVRAGISRFAEWDHFGVTLDEEETGLVVSMTAPDLGDRPWPEKVLELVAQPLHEALWSAGLYEFERVRRDMGEYRAGGYLAVPYADRIGVEPEAFRGFEADAAEHCIAPLHGTRVHIEARDQAGGFLALSRAAEELEAGVVDVAVVGGIDSLLESSYLGWLHDAGRLKVATSAAGLIPGEAAAFLTVEREEDARRRGATPLARLGAVGAEYGRVAEGAPDPANPDAMASAARTALAASDPATIHRVVVDLNGERWRFLEWALVETRALGGLPTGWELWHPADCVGDLGAAFGPFAVGLAVRAFARGYGGAGGILICGASDRGERAAVCVAPR